MPAEPTPQEQERARAILPCNCEFDPSEPGYDDGFKHDEYCPAQHWSKVATALAEQRERLDEWRRAITERVRVILEEHGVDIETIMLREQP